MGLEALARRAYAQPPSPSQVRDGLISWFLERAEPQFRRGMAYTSPDATNEEVHRVLRARALAFFDTLPSPFEAPTWSDLRRVKARMLGYLLPRPEMRRALERESALWDALLVGERQLDPAG